MSVTFDYRGRTVVVTGATRGIGLALAEAYAAAAANLVVTGTSPDSREQLEAHLIDLGAASAKYVAAGFLDPTSLDAVLETLRSIPRVDVLVNNAGINRIALATDVDPDDFEDVLSVNLRAPYRCCQVAALRMREAGYGRILNIGSIWSVITKPGRSAYTVSKTGLVGLTRTLAVELAQYGVLANTLSPGFTLTELTRSTLTPEEFEALAMQVPARRFAEPREMATAALFLTSEANSYMTGQNVVVDGGFTHV